jgi:hypothetical protein
MKEEKRGWAATKWPLIVSQSSLLDGEDGWMVDGGGRMGLGRNDRRRRGW